tara:strand:+ start:1464 stop:1967 length:504 start_codon:yes stop_codon:yes gene_type:complete
MPPRYQRRINIISPASLSHLATALAKARLRNRHPVRGGSGCPVIVEGRRDMETLRSLGFEGPIELANRGWGQSRLIAYLCDSYGRRNPVDGGPALILLLDWDRTGIRLHENLLVRMRSLDMRIDVSTRKTLMHAVALKAPTIEGLKNLVDDLIPLINLEDPPPDVVF